MELAVYTAPRKKWQKKPLMEGEHKIGTQCYVRLLHSVQFQRSYMLRLSAAAQT